MPVRVDKKRILPQFPRTLHLPWKPNTQRGDLVASEEDAKIIFEDVTVEVTEKIDGANAGVAFVNGDLIVRNHNHVLNKGYLKDTPAKIQFRSLWNWAYDNRDKIESLGGISVYGEWLVAQHGLEYNELPSYFIAHSLYDYQNNGFLDPVIATALFKKADFYTAPVLTNKINSYEELEALTKEPAAFTNKGQREGIYVKVGDGIFTSHRFKMIREGFVQGNLWSETKINPNKLKK